MRPGIGSLFEEGVRHPVLLPALVPRYGNPSSNIFLHFQVSACPLQSATGLVMHLVWTRQICGVCSGAKFLSSSLVMVDTFFFFFLSRIPISLGPGPTLLSPQSSRRGAGLWRTATFLFCHIVIVGFVGSKHSNAQQIERSSLTCATN